MDFGRAPDARRGGLSKETERFLAGACGRVSQRARVSRSRLALTSRRKRRRPVPRGVRPARFGH